MRKYTIEVPTYVGGGYKGECQASSKDEAKGIFTEQIAQTGNSELTKQSLSYCIKGETSESDRRLDTIRKIVKLPFALIALPFLPFVWLICFVTTNFKDDWDREFFADFYRNIKHLLW